MKHKRMKRKRIERKPEDYKSILATEDHELITSMDQVRRGMWDSNRMGLFYQNEPIGHGELSPVSRRSKDVHTDCVSLNTKHRKKGHGIHLYHHLIRHASWIGARRIYSSTSLNKFSRRMWSEKLPKYYNVKKEYHKEPCECGSNLPRINRYYIELKSS